MVITRIKINILTEKEHKYGVDLNLYENDSISKINLVLGENTLGKSTLIKSIVYALGGEEIYGKLTYNSTHFPEVMKRINDEKIILNEVYLELKKDDTYTVIVRNALNRHDSVKVYVETKIDDIKEESNPNYYRISKSVGIEANDLFQEYLFQLFDFPYLLNAESNLALLYIQNLMPLFIIPQTGWGDIQSNNPYYNVKEVKQKAFEVIMGFNDIKNFEEKISLKIKKDKKKGLVIQKKKFIEAIEIYNSKTILENAELVDKLQNELDELLIKKENMESSQLSNSNSLAQLKNKYLELNNIHRKNIFKKDMLEREIKDYKSYINSLELEILKIDKLNNAKKLISHLPIKQCPHCFNEVDYLNKSERNGNNCMLCGSEFEKRKNSTNDEIFSYLKDEKKDFVSILNLKKKELDKIISKIDIVELDIKESKMLINSVELNLKPQLLDELHIVSSEIGRSQSELIALEKEKNILLKIESIERNIIQLNSEIKKIEDNLKAINKEDNDKMKFEDFESNFKDILLELDFLKDGFDDKKLEEANKKYFDRIYIDSNSYYPKIDNQNLYNITSSSGFIRIILSYYLALLKTSFSHKTMNHPRILIMDEPKQQNLDDKTYKKLTNYLLEFKKLNSNFQVIFASGDKGNLLADDILINLEDYLIRRIDD